MFRLDQKVAIVTGGGSGIGQAICEAFARQGAKVHLLDINESGAQGTISSIQAWGGEIRYHQCDLSKQKEVKAVFAEIWQHEQAVDILVNNAAIAHIGTAESTTEAELDRVYTVNIKGV